MGVKENFEQHWLVIIILVVAASVGATWTVLNEVLVRPRDEESSRLTRRMEDLEAKQQTRPSADVAPNGLAREGSSDKTTDKLTPTNQADVTGLRAESNHSVRQEEAVKSLQLPKQESRGPNSPNIFQGGSGSIDVRINEGSSIKPPPYAEPSDKEMRQALFDQIKRRGGIVRDSNTVATENMLAGVAVEIVEFEKLGCNVASYGAGYFCTYRLVSRPKFYSTEGTEAGDKHAQGVTMLMKWVMGGDTNTETATRRLTKAVDGWVVSAE